MKLLIISISLTLIVALWISVLWASAPADTHIPANQLHSFKVNSKPGTKDTFSVMTYNVGYFSGMTNNLPLERTEQLFSENMQNGLKMLWNTQPDILGLQEVDYNANRSFHYNQQDTIALRLGYTHAYQSVNWNKRYVPFPYWPPSVQFGSLLSGQSILSLYPLASVVTKVLQAPNKFRLVRGRFYLDRLMQIAMVTLDDTDVMVINVHLEAFDKPTRVRQASEVLQTYEAYAQQYPVLLIGDFNSELQDDDAIDMIMKGMHISSALTSSPSNNTYSSRSPEVQIDHILYNNNFIEMVNARVISEAGEVSDHLPLLMNFTFK